MKKSQVIRYNVDPHNRLIIAKTGKKSEIPGFRYVLDGRFKIGSDHTVSYHLKHPQSSPIPQQLKLSGKWSLDKNHNLLFTLDKKHNQVVKDRLTLKTELISAAANKMEFLIASKDRKGRAHLYILSLSGRWQADKHNRLNFFAARKNDQRDEITLGGGWEINRKNQLIYAYSKTALKTKKKITHSITLKGYWELNKKYRITYVLDKRTNSGFDFKVGLARAVKAGLQYEISAGVKPKEKKVTLFGKWKLDKNLGLVFEMPAEDNRRDSISFGARLKLKENSYLEAKLKGPFGDGRGIELKLSKAIIAGESEAFLKALKDGEEVTISAGAGFRW